MGRIPVGVGTRGLDGEETLDCIAPPVGVETIGLIGVDPVALGVSGDGLAESVPNAVRLVGEGGPARKAAKPVLPFLIALGERGAGKRDPPPDFCRYSKL